MLSHRHTSGLASPAWPRCGLLHFAAALLLTAPAGAELTGLSRLASGLNSPTYVTHAPGDLDHLYVLEKSGAIRVLDRATGAEEGTFLTIPDTEDKRDGGLLGLAFHPEFQQNGKFYVHVTVANDGATFQGASAGFTSHIREYTATSPTSADVESKREILQAIQPQPNHNGGWIDFSPTDGYLYIAFGDGGGGNDNQNGHTDGTGNAQDLTDNPHGKMLRIDVNGNDFPSDPMRNYAIPESNPFIDSPGDDEIWAYGLRNPWRASFDRSTGDLWIGDVGQNEREEIDWQADGTAGSNYGWRLREGTIATPGVGGEPPEGAVEPVYDYLSDGEGLFGGNSVVGGYLYRGPDPELQGLYFFADTVPAQLWTFDPEDPRGTVENVKSILVPDEGAVNTPVSFGEDSMGNLYLVDLDGDLFRIDTSIMTPGDYNEDGLVDAADYTVWADSQGQAGVDLAADGDGSGQVELTDYLLWNEAYGMAVDGLGAASPLAAVPEPATLSPLLMALAALGGFRRVKAVCPRRQATTD